ncbi:MAG: ADP-forming succinate--CoA ligase subunit beta [Bacteroidales bacterium]|nr:ADP-forming succinate--CoA ligase subunit beta [Bacteroidales bacterium]
MLLHEYQAKNLLKNLGVYKIPIGYYCGHIENVEAIAEQVFNESKKEEIVIKAQIHAGGRGKAGGIKKAKTVKEAIEKAKLLLGTTLVTPQTGPEGKVVRKLYIEEGVYYGDVSKIKEYYFSITLDRSTSDLVMIYSPEGGMDIEEVAEKNPEKIYKLNINSSIGITSYMIRKVLKNLGITDNNLRSEFTKFIQTIYDAYLKIDASLIEINPLIKTSDDTIYIADSKIIIDDNALFKHPDYYELRDLYEENPDEVEASNYHLNFIKLNGNVGCMVNGAGLAMATMDLIKLAGGEPANFLDVGGTANAQTVEAGFRILLRDPNVKVVFINIFGGIVRCDRVAAGIIEAYNKIKDINIPIVVRLQGTNSDLAKEMIEKSGLKINFAMKLDEAAIKINELLKNIS